MNPTPSPPLSLRTKLSYGFGSIAFGVTFTGLAGGVLQIYLNQVLGLPAAIVGAAIMLSLMADALVDPLIGRWSDRASTRLGRRHPFMYASALPVSLGFVLVWNAPHALTGGALLAFSLAVMVVTRISISFYEIPSNALTPELTPDYDRRTTLQSYRWFFGIIGSAGISVVLNEVFLRVSAAHPEGVLYREGYARFGVLAAAVIFVSILVSTVGTQDRIPFLPKAAPRAATQRQAWREIGATLANPSLIALMVSGLLGGIQGGVVQGLSIYLYTHFWDLGPKEIGILVPMGSIGSILAVFLAPAIARRFGKKSAMIGLFSVSVVTAAGPVFLRLVGWMVPNRSPWLLPILGIDAIVTLTVAIVGFILVGSMMADVVEDAAVRSGVRSEGLLYAVNGLLPKFTGGIGLFIGGLLLSFVHFPAHALRGTVDPALMRHLAMIYLPVTAGLSILSIAVLGFYRIDRTSHARNLATLAEAAATAIRAHGVEAVEAGETTAPVSRVF